jgi:hypothetical protein
MKTIGREEGCFLGISRSPFLTLLSGHLPSGAGAGTRTKSSPDTKSRKDFGVWWSDMLALLFVKISFLIFFSTSARAWLVAANLSLIFSF